MPNICLYFQIHQPWRLRKLTVFDLDGNGEYFDGKESKNTEVIQKVAEKSYRPMFALLSQLIRDTNFRFSLSITGVAIEQLQKYCPDIIATLQDLANSGRVEFLGETYYHSLASLYSPTEFYEQITKHRNLIKDLFNQYPEIFRNTELIYSNQIAWMVKQMGFKGILAEGADKILCGRRPTYVYRSPDGLPVLLKHYQLSDDVAFRFSQSSRSEKPLTAETFSHWISSSFNSDETVNLFMDFETFGEHQWKDTGIFDFFYYFVKRALEDNINFLTVSEVIKKYIPRDTFDSFHPISWADVDRDVTAWRGNDLQNDSLKKIYGLEKKILKCDDSLIEDWRKLQTSDHYYYMCTKWANDGDVHAYFSPYRNPYNAYVNFCHVLADLKLRINRNLNV